MQRLRAILTLTLLAPSLGVLVLASGCGKSGDQSGQAANTQQQPAPPSGEKPKAFVVKEGDTGSIKGRVVYAGDPPMLPPITDRPDFKTNSDKAHCEQGPTANQSWVIGQDKGVANVFVWVKPPGRDYFVVPESKRKDTREVVVDQPHCAFEPHAVVLFPKYRDDKGKEQSTGQTFVVKNSAPINHNTKLQGSPKANPEKNVLIKGKSGDTVNQEKFDINPDSQAISIQCDLHKWMNGYAWAFDHPYAALTDKDGYFEIKDVPAGSEIYVVAWHEGGGYLLPDGKGSNLGQKITVEKGKPSVVDFKVTKKD